MLFRRAISVLALCAFALPALAYDIDTVPIPNARPAWLIADHSLPMVTLQLTVPDAGGVSDPAGKDGRAYVAARMLQEGAGEYDNQAFQRLLESRAIQIDSSVSEDSFSLSVTTLTKNLPEALRLAGLMLNQPRFDDAALARVKGQVAAEIRQRQERPGYIAAQEWDKAAYGTHPYATPVDGTPESIAALSVTDMKAWRSQLAKQRLILSIVGDTDVEDLTTLLAQMIGPLPAKAVNAPIVPAPTVPLGKPPVFITRDVPQSVAMFGLPAPERADPDFYATYVMNYILGGGSLVSRLSSAIRQERGLAYSADSVLVPGLHGSALIGQYATRNETAAEATEVMEDVLARFKRDGVTDAEVKNAVDYITGSFPLELDTQAARASYLSIMQLYDLGPDYLDKRNGYFTAVTTADVNRVAAKWLDSKPLLVIVGTRNEKKDVPDAVPAKN